MNFSKRLRIGLVVFMIASVLVIVWNFLSRSQEVVSIPEASILSPEISHRSTKFEYTEHKSGRTVFRVDADTSIETVDGIHTLNDVSLAYFGEGDTPSDVISGRQAVYRIQEKQIVFSGDTEIRLSDGTRIFSDQVMADLDREIVTIAQDFEFEKGEIGGKGRSLIYPIPKREIGIGQGMQLVIASETGELHARAAQAVYQVSRDIVELLGSARILGPNMELSSRRIKIFMTQEQTLRKILGSGQSLLRADSSRSFSGQAINIFFDPEHKQLKYFEAIGSASLPTSHRAVYEQQHLDGAVVLEADRILAVPRQERVEDLFSLASFTARGSVSFSSPEMGIREARADEFEGKFFDDGQNLRELDLKGAVSARRSRKGPNSAVREDLRCEALNLRLGGTGTMEYALARGAVDLRVHSEQGYRHLSNAEIVEIDYSDGSPERVVSRGNSRVESVFSGEKNILTAPLIELQYRAGLLDSVDASEGVRLEFVEQDGTRYTNSERLKIVYQKGVMEKAMQSGNFRLWEGNPETVDVKSDQAVFDPGTQRIQMSGEQRAVLKFRDSTTDSQGPIVETVARQFQLDRKTGELTALGEVRSIVPEPEGSILITASEMHSERETGWVSYFGDPRIVQRSNSIVGKTVRYNHREQQLVVEEKVESSLFQGVNGDQKTYWVEADRLVYERGQLRARYEGAVSLKADDLVVEAPFVDFVFEQADPNQLRHIFAWGGVEITEANREATGSRAEHYPAEKKVILTGQPAQVFELEKGKAAGRRLTFYLGDERLLVENPSTPETP